ncbi:hypothetical protein ABDI02_07585 [Priestia megaterium]
MIFPEETVDQENVSKTMGSIIAPVIKQFQPELIIISAGQDATALDPISRLMVTREGFKYMANKMRELEETYCYGRLIVAQEGGYN